jgi:hypothetical protein
MVIASQSIYIHLHDISGIAFDKLKSIFNTQKTRLIKKIKNIFEDLKNLKMVKTHFCQKVNEYFA